MVGTATKLVATLLKSFSLGEKVARRASDEGVDRIKNVCLLREDDHNGW